MIVVMVYKFKWDIPCQQTCFLNLFFNLMESLIGLLSKVTSREYVLFSFIEFCAAMTRKPTLEARAMAPDIWYSSLTADSCVLSFLLRKGVARIGPIAVPNEKAKWMLCIAAPPPLCL